MREKYIAMLVDHGLWPDEAEAVMLSAENADPIFSETMRSGSEGYPPHLHAAVWLTLTQSALAWIDSNKPKHFARAMFSS